MSRLFLSLFAIIFIAIIGFFLGIDGASDFMFKGMLEDLREKQLGGIILQLDDDIKGLNKQQREQRIKQLQDLFQYDVDLENIESMQLTEHEKSRLRKDEFVTKVIDQAEFSYHRSHINHDMAWTLQIESTLTEQDQDFLVGPIALMNKKLAATPIANWKQAIEQINQKFGIPIYLISLKKLRNSKELDTKQMQQLVKGEFVLFYQSENLEYIYSLIPDSNMLLKIGKIEVPLILKNFTYVVVAMLASLMGVAIWLWLRPVWQDLRKLRKASDNIGQGQLNTRIEISKYSFIKGILNAFNSMANHIEQLITSHKTLTNAVSHELRTPVSRLRFSLEMLEKSNNSEDKQRHLTSMNTDIDELDDMLAELLSYARMDRQTITLEKASVHVIDWLHKQTEKWQKNCNNITLNISHNNVADTAITFVDNKLMARALHNLLQNACRYAKKQISIHLEYQNGYYLLSIDDDGCGIPKPYHRHIFDPFTRVDDSRDRDSGGYGLGLAIVKQIAHAHQGEISIQNSDLGGVKFLLQWPTKQ